jgi:hypothetical protein
MLNPKRLLSENFGQPVGNQWLEMQQQEAAQKSFVAKHP